MESTPSALVLPVAHELVEVLAAALSVHYVRLHSLALVLMEYRFAHGLG